MKTKEQTRKYKILHWISIALLIIGILVSLGGAGLYLPKLKWWGILFICTPFVIPTIISWFEPIIGGILAIIFAPIWVFIMIFLSLASNSDGSEIQLFIIQGVILAVAGIFSISYGVIANKYIK
jgi:hypothetical protein